MSSTADIIYIYKDGPEFPDSELTGEQQLAEQRAYVESFAKFEEDEANDGDDRDGHASDSGTEDYIPSDDEGADPLAEPPADGEQSITDAGTSRFLEEILAEERRVEGWKNIVKEINDFMKTVPPRDITASKNLLNLSCALKPVEPRGVDIVLWTGDDSAFAIPEYWDYTLDCIKKMDARETVDGIVGKLFRSAFTKYRDDIQALMVEAAQVQPSGDTAMEEDEVNFISWLEYFGRSGSWITTSELLTRIWNHLSTYGPPPLVSLDEPRSLFDCVPVKKVGDPIVAQRDLRNILLLYHYFRTRSETLISQITDQMMDEEDSQGHRRRMVTEIVRLRKGFNSKQQKPKWRRVKREVPTPFFPTLPVSAEPTKAELAQEPQEKRTARLKARKRELEYFVWERVGANDPGESFDKWLKGDTK